MGRSIPDPKPSPIAKVSGIAQVVVIGERANVHVLVGENPVVVGPPPG